ncbi:hypothetical protein ACOMHN_011668 [Nucella lapillus]
MADHDKDPLIPSAAAQSQPPTTKMAEESHPLPAEKTSAKRGSLKAASSSKDQGDSDPGTGTSTPGGSSTPKRRLSCPVYFGVRSYLHQFYDRDASYKDPAVYEDDDDLYPPHLRGSSSHRRCPPIWWKIFMWVGVNLLLFGVVGILVGYLVPPKAVIVGEDKAAGEWYIDPSARKFNMTLDAFKLIGLGLFCIGGITLALSLLFPSFLHYCHDEDDDHVDDESKVPLRGPEGDRRQGAPLSPLERSIPATSKVRSVQPSCKAP